jgi:hypothetical protein
MSWKGKERKEKEKKRENETYVQKYPLRTMHKKAKIQVVLIYLPSFSLTSII